MSATKKLRLRRTVKQKHSETVGRKFANAVSKVCSDLSKESYAESLRTLREIEAEYVAQLSNHPEFALELRRRIAELTLEQALIHGCTQRQCRMKLAFAEKLGWSIIERNLHFHLIYARGMVARGHYRTARAAANRSIADVKQELERIEGLPRRIGRKHFVEWLALFNEIISETEHSGLEGYSSRWGAGGSFIRRHPRGDESEK